MVRKALQALLVALLFVAVAFAPSGLGHPLDATVFAPIQPGGFMIRLDTVATGLTAPLKGAVAPGHPGRLFVVDQAGILWAVDLTTGAKTVFLDVTSRIVSLGVVGAGSFDERGLLGVAFHPGYRTNGKLYTYTSEPNAGAPTFPTTIPAGATADHQNVVAEWRVPNPGNPASVVDPASRRELMRVDWPQFNHDGGDLSFGPVDGMLYISMGDGGGADDRDGQLFIKATGSLPPVEEPIIGHGLDGNAQTLSKPLGKILRIDVDGSNSANGQYGIPPDNPFVNVLGAVKEIYALGLRNPYRFSFDKDTGALFSSDAGQNDLEEIDLIVKGGNYGWRFKEGTMFFDHNGNDPGFATPVAPGPVPGGLIDPIAQYDTHHEGHAIIGGFVYRGSRIPELFGRYVFGDYSRVFLFPAGPNNQGRLLYLQHKKTSQDRLQPIHEFRFADRNVLGLAVLGFGQDAAGEVYALANKTGNPFGTDGRVLRLAAVSMR